MTNLISKNHLRLSCTFLCQVFVLCISILLLGSCRSDKSPNSSSFNAHEYPVPSDSLFKKEIEKRVELLNDRLLSESLFYQLPLPIHSDKDTLKYWVLDHQPVRISIESYMEEFMEWPTFFLQDTELMMVRYRCWSQKLPTPWALESMIYIQQGKPVYCEERRMDLAENEIPAHLRLKPFHTSQRSFSEIEADYLSYWSKIKLMIDQQELRPTDSQ